MKGVTAPVPGFGSSDCRAGCKAHLYRLPDNSGLAPRLEDSKARRIRGRR
jgi:Uri superfamily endonuclease